MGRSLIYVLGTPVKLDYRDLGEVAGGGTYGEWVADDRVLINVRQSLLNQQRTIIHEYAHGLFEDANAPDQEIDDEQFARLFEKGVEDLVRFNWQHLTMLRYAMKGETYVVKNQGEDPE